MLFLAIVTSTSLIEISVVILTHIAIIAIILGIATISIAVFPLIIIMDIVMTVTEAHL